MAIMRHSFIFGGVNSADYGIYIGGEGTYNAPKRAVESVSIPGRNGDLLIDQGRYENIEVTYSGFNYETDLETFAIQLGRFRNAIMSLKGYQKLTDSFHPEEYRLAAYMDDFEIKPIMYNTAAKFDIVFNCKPQRFLTAGEDPVTVTTSGASVYNPTLFESQPLLGVEGYGTIQFNSYEIELSNEVLGEFELYPSGRVVAPKKSITVVYGIKTFNLDTVNTGDTLTIGSHGPAVFNAKQYVAFESGVSATSQTNSTTGASGTTKGSILASGMLFASISIDSFSVTVGTPSAKTRTATYTIVCNDNGTTRDVVYVLQAIADYDGNDTITYTVTDSFSANPNSIAYRHSAISFEYESVIADSSVSVLGHPTYIDCELGEAYQIKNGEMISLNRYIDLGSDIPVLAPGANAVTFDNTITSIEVRPRWWRL